MTTSTATRPGPTTDSAPGAAAAAMTSAGLAGLMVLHVTTLVAAFTLTDPHPPLAVVPFIATVVAIALAAVVMIRDGARVGFLLAALVAAASVISFGPHKLVSEGMPAIAPAVLAGMAFELTIAVAVVRRLIGGRR